MSDDLHLAVTIVLLIVGIAVVAQRTTLWLMGLT